LRGPIQKQRMRSLPTSYQLRARLQSADDRWARSPTAFSSRPRSARRPHFPGKSPFLAVAGTPDKAAAELRAFARNAHVALDAALDRFESRTGVLAARGIDVNRILFSTAFGRGVDYYTGVVFELHDPQGLVKGQLVAGGRYDGLLTRLGSPSPIPAVGFAVWVERLARLRSAS